MGRERIILLTTVLGLIIGGMACYLLGKYFPDYTARTYVQVLPPLQAEPIASASAVTQKDIQYGHRLSIVNLIKQQSTLRELVDRDKIRQTKWFGRFGGPVDKAVRKACEDLEKRFGALAHRDADFIEIWMTCHEPEDAKVILNEMLEVLSASQGTEKAETLSALESQRDVVQRELDAIVKKKALDLPRTQSEQLEKTGDEKAQMLIALNMQIEKLRIILDDPEKVRVKRVARAPLSTLPLQMRYPIWAFLCLPGGGILGFVFGLMFVSLSKRAEDKKDCSD